MVDTALENRLDGVLLLLVMAVSLLSGLVFGKDYGGEALLAVVSFVVLGLTILILGMVRSASSE